MNIFHRAKSPTHTSPHTHEQILQASLQSPHSPHISPNPSHTSANPSYPLHSHSKTLEILSLLRQSKKDFFSPFMLALNIAPVLLGLMIWGGIFYSFSDTIIAHIQALFPASWLAYTASNSMLAHGITISLYVMLGFCVILLALVGNIFISVFYVPLVVRYLHKHYYAMLAKPADTLCLSQTLTHFLKAFVMLCALCIVCAPLLFMPIIGGVIMLVPFFVFFYQSMLYDIGHEVLGESSYTLLRKAKRKYTATFLAYILGLIPGLNFFTPLLQVIFLSHFCFQLRIKAHI